MGMSDFFEEFARPLSPDEYRLQSDGVGELDNLDDQDVDEEEDEEAADQEEDTADSDAESS